MRSAYFLRAEFGGIVVYVAAKITSADMRTDRCTFVDMRRSLSEAEFTELYLGATLRLENEMESNTVLGDEILKGAATGCSYSTTFVEIVGGPSKGGDYILDAIEYLEAHLLVPRRWTMSRVRANVLKKARQLIAEVYRQAESKQGVKTLRKLTTLEVHEHLYDLEYEDFYEYLIGCTGVRNPIKRDVDAVALCERLLDDEATEFTNVRRIKFNEAYICAQEGWTPDIFRHAKRQLFVRGSEFLKLHSRRIAHRAGFVFLSELDALEIDRSAEQITRRGDER